MRVEARLVFVKQKTFKIICDDRTVLRTVRTGLLCQAAERDHSEPAVRQWHYVKPAEETCILGCCRKSASNSYAKAAGMTIW